MLSENLPMVDLKSQKWWLVKGSVETLWVALFFQVKLLSLTICLEGSTSYEEGSLTNVQSKMFRLSMSDRAQMDHGLVADALLLFDQVELEQEFS